VVCQASSYYDEWDTFMESAKEADEWDFQNFVVANTADKPADALQRLLPKFGSCPALFSRTFQIVLGNSGDVVTVAEM
jgi:N-acyl-L-homoserine lactone synthetase